jgi:hypothetical protein
MKFNLQSKLGAWALIAVLMLGIVPTVGCSGQSVAQQIVGWTPFIDSALTTLGSVAGSLSPQDSVIIDPVVTALVTSQNLLKNQAQAYLANPTAGVLAQLQAQAVTFQQSLNSAVLTALKITNSDSQKRIIAQIQVVLTGATAVLALLQTIKGNTLTVTTGSVTTSQVLPYLDESKSVALVAEHEGVPSFVASYRVHQAEASLIAAGL